MTFFSPKNLVKIGYPPVMVLALHTLRVTFLPLEYQLDMVMHFLGGLSMAWVAWNSYRYLRAQNFLPELPSWFVTFGLVAFAELIGVIWEFWEFFLQSRWQNIGLTLEDTMMDLVLDVSGALLFALILRHGFVQPTSKAAQRKKK